MIYLIKSAAYSEDGYSNLLKIGYTSDSSKEKRYATYQMHNPTFKVLKEIEFATENHERKLHYKFQNYLYPSYGREWFYDSEEILNYFESVTLENLENLPDPILTLARIKEIAEIKLIELRSSNLNFIDYHLKEISELKITTLTELESYLSKIEIMERYERISFEDKLFQVFKISTCLPESELLRRLRHLYKEYGIKRKATILELNKYFKIVPAKSKGFYWIEKL